MTSQTFQIKAHTINTVPDGNPAQSNMTRRFESWIVLSDLLEGFLTWVEIWDMGASPAGGHALFAPTANMLSRLLSVVEVSIWGSK